MPRHQTHASKRLETALVILLAAVPGLAAWKVYGIIKPPDTAAYLAYAALIRQGAVPSGQALLHQGAMPISLFRAPGYPAFIAGLQAALPHWWSQASVLLQIALCAAVSGATYHAALRFGVRRSLAIAAALLPSVGFIVVLQICLLTDALNAVFFTGAALCLLIAEGMAGACAAGLSLALATTFREATPFLALFFLPLAASGGRRPLARMTATIVPPLCVVAAMMAWNEIRIGRPAVTTTAEVNMVQPLFPLIRKGLPVYSGADPFDRAAREMLTRPDYDQINDMLQHLFVQQNITAPDLAAMATARYWRAWRRFPLEMLWNSARRFRTGFLNMPFQPLDTIVDLDVYSGRQLAPDLVKLGLLWHRTLHGDMAALGWLMLVSITRSIGIAVAVIGIVGPWLPGRSWRLRSLWLVCAGVPLTYMPVHLDSRFLLPTVPLLCIAAAASLAPTRAREAGARFRISSA